MVKFTLNDIEYKTPGSWSEIKFGKFLSYLETILSEMPKALQDIYQSENMVEDWANLSAKQKAKCYHYFAKSVGFWCGIDANIIKKSMLLEELEAAYWAIDIDLNLDNVQIDEDFTGFRIGNTEYLLPQKHMEGSTVLEFTESAQFELNMAEVKNGNWLALLDVMTVICRPQGEVYEYTKQRNEIRKKAFRELTMDIILNVSFFLLRLNDTLKNTLLIYSLLQHKQQIEKSKLARHTAGI
jgi:hypothetical protein